MTLERKTPLRRGKPLGSRGRVNRSNRKRKAKAYARNFGDEADAVRAMPCLACGRRSAPRMDGASHCGPAQAAHVTARGMGAVKGGRFDLVPLCGHHHALAGEAGTSQRAAFEARHGLDLRAEADRVALEHGDGLGLRVLAARWQPVGERQCGECSAPAACRGSDGEPMCIEHGEPLDSYELDALLGWVRRAMQAEHDRRRAHACDGPRWAVYIGDVLGIRSDDNAGGPVAGAWALCDAAGWPS